MHQPITPLREAKPRAEGGRAKRIVLKEPSLEYFYTQFLRETGLLWVTINPYKKSKFFTKFQKIGPISDWLRKKCARFLVVQETNTDGSKHYHAIAKLLPKYKRSTPVFKHANIQYDRIGNVGTVPSFNTDSMLPPLTVEDKKTRKYKEFLTDCLYHWKVHEIADRFARMFVCLWNKQRLAKNREKRKLKLLDHGNHLSRVLNYMAKESRFSIYQDMMFYGLKPPTDACA